MRDASTDRMAPWERLAAWILIGLTGLSRIWGLGFGEGFDARPDEPGVVLGFDLLRQGKLSPSLLLYGGGYYYPVFVIDCVRQWLTGSHDPTWFDHRAYVAARAWSALLSTATVWCVLAAARSLLPRGLPLLAAAIVAAVPLAVREGHFAKADSAAAFASALLLLAYARRRADRSRAIGIGAATGLALCTKYSIGVLPAALLALTTGPRSRGATHWRAVLIAGAAAFVVGIALNLHWFVWPVECWTWLPGLFQRVTTAEWLPGGDTVAGPLSYHARVSLRYGCGLGVALLSLPAVVLGLFAAGPQRIVSTHALGLFAVVLVSPMVLSRFFLPVLPPLAVLVAGLVGRAVSTLAPPASRLLVLWLAAGALVAAPLLESVRFLDRLRRADTRRVSADWIARQLPTEARIVSWGAPPKVADFGRPPMRDRKVFKGLAPQRWRSAGITHIVVHSYPLPYSSEPLPAAPSGARLESLFVADPFLEDASGVVLEPLDAFYLPLSGAGAVRQPGPRIEVFKIAWGVQKAPSPGN